MIESMKKVVIARDPERAAPLMTVLETYGVISHAIPVTRIVFNDIEEIPAAYKECDIIAFTSANAVKAFSRIMKEKGLELGGNQRIAAIGQATAEVGGRELRKPDLVPAKSDADSIARIILENSDSPTGLSVFWPCGNESLPDFENVIVKAGAQVIRWECYRTEPLDTDGIKSGLARIAPWDLAFFAAPSAVRAFSRAWEDRTDFIALAIGPTTEKALHNAGYEKVAVSKGTSVMQCAGAIIDALQLKIWS